MPQADDAAIRARAVQVSRVVVTNGKDFGDLDFRSGLTHAGIVRLREESSVNRNRILQAVLAQCGDLLPSKVVVPSESQIRIRPVH